MAQLASQDPLEHIEAVTAWEYVAIHLRIPPALKRQVLPTSHMQVLFPLHTHAEVHVCRRILMC